MCAPYTNISLLNNYKMQQPNVYTTLISSRVGINSPRSTFTLCYLQKNTLQEHIPHNGIWTLWMIISAL